ncbi:MAG: DUF421 domain-containing protein [Sphaerobacteraceae bacterium]|nr:MAG: DUF421 domain-containing protein [Sphaerobacteraceae bacterium]
MNTEALFGTGQALEIAITAVVFYGYMVLLLRISGKRTTMSMTTFDFVSTVAMATIVGSTILQGTVSLLEGMVAVTVLVALQWVAGSVSARSPVIRHFITSSPAVLYENGQFNEENLMAERISREQLQQKIRAAGHGNLATVNAIVLESAGTVSVVEKGTLGDEVDPET